MIGSDSDKDKLKIPTSRDFGIEKLNLSVNFCSVQCGEFEFLAFLALLLRMLPGEKS